MHRVAVMLAHKKATESPEQLNEQAIINDLKAIFKGLGPNYYENVTQYILYCIDYIGGIVYIEDPDQKILDPPPALTVLH